MRCSKAYLCDIQKLFRYYKSLSDKSIKQVPDSEFFTVLSIESNSVAILVKHMAGNLRSRWRDFLSSDGEKEDRNRDNEFVILKTDTKRSLMADWETAWSITLETIEQLTAEDLSKTVTIRSEPHSVIEALNRGLTHTAYHTGQFTLLAKHFAGAKWKTLSIAKGESEQFLQSKQKKHRHTR